MKEQIRKGRYRQMFIELERGRKKFLVKSKQSFWDTWK